MSFNSNPSRVEYVVNTKTTTFTFNFKIFEPENLVVYKIPSGTSPDDETNKLSLNVDYTVSINGDLGGFITLLKTPTIHDIIIIQRTLSIDRVTDFVNNGGIYSDVLNNDQDYQTYLIVDNEIENARHLKLPVTAVGVSSTLPTPIPNRYMLWNPQGTALINDVNAPTWLTDAKGWAIHPKDELFTDSTGTIDYSSKHYALYTSGRLDKVQTNGETLDSNIDLLSTLDVQISNIGNNIDALLSLSDNLLVVSGNVQNIADINTNALNIDSIITNAANIIDIQNAAENAIITTKKATEASDSADYSELRKWESESFRLTAESYAVEPEDIYVKIYTSNGNGTFTVTHTTDYSALHYKAKAFASSSSTNLSGYYKKTETYSKVETNSLVTTKQDVLVSGTSIKTINGQSVLGNGDIVIEEAANKQYVDTRINAELQPKMIAYAVMNGDTNNTITMNDIVSTLGLESGDVVRIQYSGYDKLHSIESTTGTYTITVNYEHAGNRCNGSLRLPTNSTTITVTRVAKRYNASIGLGRAILDVGVMRAKQVNYVNTSGREMFMYISLASGTAAATAITVDGKTVGYGTSAQTGNTFIVPKDSIYSSTTTRAFTHWMELR